jgi:hypothetical protein
MRTVWLDKSYPRGATWDGQGVNLALFIAGELPFCTPF